MELGDERAFFRLTPGLLVRRFRAANKARANRQAEHLSLAWHTEAFARTKRLPRLETLLRRIRRERRSPQTDDQMQAAALAWHRALSSTQAAR